MPNPGAIAWSLKVARGRERGTVYPVGRGETVLGNALNGTAGIDLAGQEIHEARRMAGRHARLDCGTTCLTVSDLDSPGGTFVNRQRLLPGQARALNAGDLIQLGGVQLEVSAVEEARPDPAPAPRPPDPRPVVPPPVSRTGPLERPYQLASGGTCRNWDDFLTIAAQRWGALRDELTSGRLSAFFQTLGRVALAPPPVTAGTPDERLDAWLASLPTIRTSQPELDVHPETIVVRSSGAGGITSREVQITNVGYRLLRSTARVETGSEPWLRLPGAFAAGPFVTIERTVLPIEIALPETIAGPLAGVVVIEGNGGVRRVTIRVEPSGESVPLPAAMTEVEAGGVTLFDLMARQRPWMRLVSWSVAALFLRALIAAGEGLWPIPPLAGPALIFSVLGALSAAALARKGGGTRDVPAAAIAGGVTGALASTILDASRRALETAGGGVSARVVLLWLALGLGLALISIGLAPPKAEGHDPEQTHA